MNFSLLTKLFLILAVLFTAPGFSMSANHMSANHEACALQTHVSSDHNSSAHSSTVHDSSISDSTAQHSNNHETTHSSANHCMDASHCMLCFSVLPSVTLSVTKADSYKPDSAIVNNWLSRTLKPEPYPPRNQFA